MNCVNVFGFPFSNRSKNSFNFKKCIFYYIDTKKRGKCSQKHSFTRTSPNIPHSTKTTHPGCPFYAKLFSILHSFTRNYLINY
jgi:hypothetical protein